LSDGSSRTSLSAAYQAVPTRMRSVVQATVEGLAVPVAIGFSGVVLLVVQSVGSTDGLILPVLTSIVVAAWVVVAVLLYRAYRENLLANLRGRTLAPADLPVEEESSLIAIDRLIGSDDERDVWLGLDLLTSAHHPGLPAELERLVVDERENVRIDALERLVALSPAAAADAARRSVDDPSSKMRSSSIRALGATGVLEDLVAISAHARDPAPDVRVAVAYASSRIGGDAVRAEVAADIAHLARSDAASDRTLAARMLGEVEVGGWIDRTALHTLLLDADAEVVNAALAALRLPDDAALLPDVVVHLDHRHTVAAAVAALVGAGESSLAIVDDGLRADEHDRHVQEMLVRAAREIAGPSAIAVLRGHIEHRDREVGLAVMKALASLGPAASGMIDGEPDLTASVVQDDLEHATHALRALVVFEAVAEATLLCGALDDELELIRRRVLAAFSMRHGTAGFNRVIFQLAQRDSHSHALALEWLDVTLTGTERAAVALLEPRRSNGERLHALDRTFPLPPLGPRAALLELVGDRDGRWRRPWIKACALYTASAISEAEFDAIAAATVDDEQSDDADERIVHETVTGLQRRRLDLV
jgi:HEAT repeat protein